MKDLISEILDERENSTGKMEQPKAPKKTILKNGAMSRVKTTQEFEERRERSGSGRRGQLRDNNGVVMEPQPSSSPEDPLVCL